MAKSYLVYIAECADKTFYTGCTNNLAKRLHAHNNSPAGAKYTRARRPVSLVYFEPVLSLSKALRREREIKKMSRAEKKRLLGLDN